MKKRGVVFLFLIICFSKLWADEGLWIPALIEKQVFTKMQTGGLRLSSDAIYSETNPSLKDAIVLIGGTCTAGIISKNGLLVTNYHCAIRHILQLNTNSQSILKQGFWAKSFSDELPVKELSVEMLVSTKEVTDIVLRNIPDTLPERERLMRISQECRALEEEAVKGTDYKASIESFWQGNQYFLFIKRIFKDIRLVGVPAENLNFGQNTDNWQWPRHSADFVLFRIYADKNNNPATYSANNRAYTPSFHLQINAKGVNKDDFTMILGYPAETWTCIPSEIIRENKDKLFPLNVKIANTKITAIEKIATQDRNTRLTSSGEYLYTRNDLLKTKGYINALEKKSLYDSVHNHEQKIAIIDSNFADLLERIHKLYSKKHDIDAASKLYIDGFLSLECIKIALKYKKIAESTDEITFQQNCDKTYLQLKQMFTNYHRSLDSLKTILIFKLHNKECAKNYTYSQAKPMSVNELETYINKIYAKTWLIDSSKAYKFLRSKQFSDRSKILQDPFYKITISIFTYSLEYVSPLRNLLQEQSDSLLRNYFSTITHKNFKNTYPDANYTLRITYGHIQPYSNADAILYNWQSTHNGILEKLRLETRFNDYKIDSTMKNLFEKHDFGKYANQNGDLPTCFLANNHTSGGNSGSPVLNADGQMIGLNFDRTIDGTANDFYYSAESCRNISLDIRYLLFIIDRYAHNERIMSELDIIE